MKTILKNLICCALLFAPFAKANAQDQSSGDIKVTVTDENNQPMVGAIVAIVAGGPSMGGATDLDGVFIFRALTPGSYDVEAHMTSYKKYVKTGIQVSAGQTAYASFPMQFNDCDTCVGVITIVATSSPVDPTFSSIKSINADQVRHLASGRDPVALAMSTSSDMSQGAGGKLVMRGARETASQIYVDGEVMYGGAGVPGGAIAQVTVLSGGIPASFGDLTGGAVIITTKSYYSGIAVKQQMYEDAMKEKEAAAQAAKAAAGKRTENGTQIIEKNTPVPAPVPANGSVPVPPKN
jgi:hypothetical protein